MNRVLLAMSLLLAAGCSLAVPARLTESAVAPRPGITFLRQSFSLKLSPRLAQQVAGAQGQSRLTLVVGAFDSDPFPTLGYATKADLDGNAVQETLPGGSPPSWWREGAAPLADRLITLPSVAALDTVQRRDARRWLWRETRVLPGSLPAQLSRTFIDLPGGTAAAPRTYAIFALLLDEGDHVLGQTWAEASWVEGQAATLPAMELAADAPWGATDLRTDVGFTLDPVRPEALIRLAGFLTGGGSTLSGTLTTEDMETAGGGLAYDDLAGVAGRPGGFWLTDRVKHSLFSVRAQQAGGLIFERWVGDAGAGLSNGASSVAQLNDPRGLAADGPDAVIVADRGNRRLARWDARTATLATLVGDSASDGTIMDGSSSTAWLAGPSLVAADQVKVAFVDGGIHLRVYDRRSDQVITLLSVAAPGIQGLAIGPDGRIWYALPDAHAVYVYDETTATVELAIGASSVPGNVVGLPTDARLREPGALAFDAAGRLWISDAGNHTLKVLGRDGHLHRWLDPGTPVQNALNVNFRLEGPVAIAWTDEEQGLLALEGSSDFAWFLKGTAP